MEKGVRRCAAIAGALALFALPAVLRASDDAVASSSRVQSSAATGDLALDAHLHLTKRTEKFRRSGTTYMWTVNVTIDIKNASDHDIRIVAPPAYGLARILVTDLKGHALNVTGPLPAADKIRLLDERDIVLLHPGETHSVAAFIDGLAKPLPAGAYKYRVVFYKASPNCFVNSARRSYVEDKTIWPGPEAVSPQKLFANLY